MECESRRHQAALKNCGAPVPIALLFEPALSERPGRSLTSRRPEHRTPASESSLAYREREMRKALASSLARLNSQRRLLAHLVLMGANTGQAQATLCIMEECYRVYSEIWEIYLGALDSGHGKRPWERERKALPVRNQELQSRMRFAAYLRSIGAQRLESARAAPKNGASAEAAARVTVQPGPAGKLNASNLTAK